MNTLIEHKPAHRWDSEHIDHPTQAKAGFAPFPDKLFVVTVVFNPQRWRSRIELYRLFEKQCKDAGTILITVECSLGDRPFEVTDPNNPHHIRLRTWSELWLKERLINIGIARLSSKYPEWNKVAWIDADIIFTKPDWAQETLHQLEHYQIVQMFSHAQDLGPAHAPIATTFQSFMYSYLSGIPYVPGCRNGYYHSQKIWRLWHPGYAWAARREALDHLGGLIDIAILGSADNHMATALIGHVEDTLPVGLATNYKQAIRGWQDSALKYIQRDVGYVEGLILHHWHGKKKDRGYMNRWKILVEEQFDPFLDLKPDVNMLWQLTDRNWKLRDKLRQYGRQRNEDSVDT